jgi:hypothetical protein
MLHARGPGLYEFLIEAELQEYFSGLKNELKVRKIFRFSLLSRPRVDLTDDTRIILDPKCSSSKVRRRSRFVSTRYVETRSTQIEKVLFKAFSSKLLR